jgi:hypothetical protein
VSALRLDHVVFATPDLDTAVLDLEKRLGVRATPGGRHAGLGTHNALLALGRDCYLEVIGPDPTQPPTERPLPFGIDDLSAGRLVTWAARAPDLDATVAGARERGYDAGAILDMSRDTPEGQHLEWRLSFRPDALGDGLVPFLIDWGETPGPALGAAAGCRLVELRGEHPDPGAVRACLDALGAELPVDPGPAPSLILTLEAALGRVELR